MTRELAAPDATAAVDAADIAACLTAGPDGGLTPEQVERLLSIIDNTATVRQGAGLRWGASGREARAPGLRGLSVVGSGQ